MNKQLITLLCILWMSCGNAIAVASSEILLIEEKDHSWDEFTATSVQAGIELAKLNIGYLPMKRVIDAYPLILSVQARAPEAGIDVPIHVFEQLLIFIRGEGVDGKLVNCLAIICRSPYEGVRGWEFSVDPTIDITGVRHFDTWRGERNKIEVQRITEVLAFHGMLPRREDVENKVSRIRLIAFNEGWLKALGSPWTPETQKDLFKVGSSDGGKKN